MTYREAIRMCEARVGIMLGHGLSPAGSDVEQLTYLEARAREAGRDQNLSVVDTLAVLMFWLRALPEGGR